MLQTRTLHTVYPCCHGPSQVVALAEVPRERYVRRCPRCGRPWQVLRTTLTTTAQATVDKLEWED